MVGDKAGDSLPFGTNVAVIRHRSVRVAAAVPPFTGKSLAELSVKVKNSTSSHLKNSNVMFLLKQANSGQEKHLKITHPTWCLIDFCHLYFFFKQFSIKSERFFLQNNIY